MIEIWRDILRDVKAEEIKKKTFKLEQLDVLDDETIAVKTGLALSKVRILRSKENNGIKHIDK